MDGTTQPSDAPSVDERGARRLGYLVVAVVFVGLGGWAALAPLDSAAIGRGVITVESYRKTVQHLEGGIVRAIHVRDGQPVERGQVLVTLDDTQTRAQLEVLRGQYVIARAREARLVAQRDGAERVSYPKELLDEIRQGGDARVREAVQVQDQTFRARRAAQEGEMGIYEQQIGQLGSRVRGLQAQQRSQEQLETSFRGELSDFDALLKEGYAERQKVRELERHLSTSEGQRAQLQAEVAGTQTQVSETRLKIVQLRKDFQREVAKELADVQQDLFGLREKVGGLAAALERTVVRTPDAGTVLGLTVHTIGAVIQPGGRMMDIVPQREKLVVEAQISTLDIDRVRVDQAADLRFSAFKTRDTPRIEGRVVAISADRLLDEQDKLPYYLARVEVTPQGLDALSRVKLVLVPGMPCEVMINTGSRTALQYLLAPLRNAAARSFKED